MLRRRHNAILVLLLALAAPLLLAGCGESFSEKITEKATEKAIEKGSGEDVDIDVDGDELNIKTKDGDASFGSSSELPKEWPDDVELPDDAKIISASSIKSDGRKMLSVAGTVSNGDDDEIVDHFADQFDGWEEVGSTDLGSDGDKVRGVVYKQGESNASISVTTEKGKDDLAFTVTLILA